MWNGNTRSNFEVLDIWRAILSTFHVSVQEPEATPFMLAPPPTQTRASSVTENMSRSRRGSVDATDLEDVASHQ